MVIALNTVLLGVCFALILYVAIDRRKWKKTLENYKPQRCSPNISRNLSEVNLVVSKRIPAQLKESSRSMDKIHRICITGGPCAGKTTSLARISERVESLGQRVFIVPEAATLLNKGGAMINMDTFSSSQKIHFQMKLMQLQIDLEDIFISMAASCGEESLILCDRGVMDGKAYISESTWQALLDEVGLSVVHLRDRRYETVIHMVTAADGAEKFYDNESNEARYETVALAKTVDENIQRAWTGHPQFNIIDNSLDSFEDKVVKCITVACDSLGLQRPIKSYRKYLVRGTSDSMIPVIPKEIHSQNLIYHETFLLTEGSTVNRLIKRGQDNSFTYTIATKFVENEMFRIKRKQVTSSDYWAFMAQKDPSRKTIKRTRQCFLYEQLYYMLDTYKTIKKGVSILRVEVEPNQTIQTPFFLDIVRDITSDPGYSTRIMAKKAWYQIEEETQSDKV